MNMEKIIKEAILKDRGNLLKPKYKKEWTEENYLRGYCYLVSEALYHYVDAFKDYRPYMIYMTETDTHWFLKNDSTGDIVDYTADQYDGIPYQIAMRRGFFKGGIQTERGWISKKGYKLAKLLKLVQDGRDHTCVESEKTG